MSVEQTTYVGPFYQFRKFTVPARVLKSWVGKFDIVTHPFASDWEYVLPNCQIPGVTRAFLFDNFSEKEAIHINPAMLVQEQAAFEKMAEQVIKDCDRLGIEIRYSWGVVSYWS